MSAQQHNTEHNPDWDAQVDLESTYQTLGQVIDGFRQLSDEDKSLFMRLFNLQLRSSAQVAAGGAFVAPAAVFAANPVAQQAPVAIQPLQTAFPVVQGAHASHLAALGQPGYTKDPKSGKTYRVVAKATRSQEFLGLENNALRAKQALDAYIKRHGLRYDRNSNSTVGLNNQAFTPTQEYSGLVDRVKTTNLAVKAYKQAHPEQFRPPQKKGNKTQKQGLPPGLMAPPLVGGTTAFVGDMKVQGSSSGSSYEEPSPKLGDIIRNAGLSPDRTTSMRRDDELLAESLRAHKFD